MDRRSLYQPHLYDLFNRGSLSGDVEFYTERALASGGAVLELGAGTGRTVFPLAEAGVEVWALEKDPEMLARLEAARKTLPEAVGARIHRVEGDMRRFDLEQRFAMIQIPFRAFLHNETRADQLETLRRCHAHLAPGGELVFNVFHPSLEVMSQHHGALAGVWRWLGDHPSPESPDETISVSEACRYDVARQRLSVRVRYDYFGEDGVLLEVERMTLELAFLYPGDIRALLHETGFELISLQNGFDGRPLGEEGQELVVVARRPFPPGGE